MNEQLRFWTDARARRFAAAVLIAVGVGVAVGYLGAARAPSASQVGDFPVFYAVGELVVEGHGRSIYQLDELARRQRQRWPQLGGEYFPFAYPAFYAAGMVPFSLLPAPVAKGTHSLFMLGCLLLALWLCRGLAPSGPGRQLVAAALAVALMPLLLSVVGGQNTALSLLLLAAALAALNRDTAKGEVLAGIALGLWLFKPHYALVSIALALVTRRWRVLLGALPTALGLYLVGAQVAGWDWVATWLAALIDYAPRDYVANQHQMVCLIGAARALGVALDLGGAQAQFLVGLGAASSLALLLFSAHRLWRAYASLAVIGPLIVVTSPHAVIYDLALALLPCLLLVDFRRDREINIVLGAWLTVALGTALRASFATQPLVLVGVAALLFTLKRTAAPR